MMNFTRILWKNLNDETDWNSSKKKKEEKKKRHKQVQGKGILLSITVVSQGNFIKEWFCIRGHSHASILVHSRFFQLLEIFEIEMKNWDQRLWMNHKPFQNIREKVKRKNLKKSIEIHQ